ncbi:hypothetical protein BIW11_02057 [Tropilaelaps mercedesae]|uniref:Ig-like domain-containing protein n=1 Tax=Tropilaelaps mercedesae TaxID=418985 RepID=A0A1V9X495_9ACAR|nr:hypothetical protein BIW11_02057 [Tropilaelaps mercedesae]
MAELVARLDVASQWRRTQNRTRREVVMETSPGVSASVRAGHTRRSSREQRWAVLGTRDVSYETSSNEPASSVLEYVDSGDWSLNVSTTRARIEQHRSNELLHATAEFRPNDDDDDQTNSNDRTRSPSSKVGFSAGDAVNGGVPHGVASSRDRHHRRHHHTGHHRLHRVRGTAFTSGAVRHHIASQHSRAHVHRTSVSRSDFTDQQKQTDDSIRLTRISLQDGRSSVRSEGDQLFGWQQGTREIGENTMLSDGPDHTPMVKDLGDGVIREDRTRDWPRPAMSSAEVGGSRRSPQTASGQPGDGRNGSGPITWKGPEHGDTPGRPMSQLQPPRVVQQTQQSGGSSVKKGVKKASIVYTAVVGGSVLLPCSLAPVSDEGDDVVLVLWYKDDISEPLFTVDARGVGDLHSARQSSLDQLKARAKFIIAPSASPAGRRRPSPTARPGQPPVRTDASSALDSGTAAHLRIEPVGESDEGEYRCRVDFKRARSINTVVNLRIIVPPGEPVIETRSGDVLRGGLTGPFNDGDPLTLHCYMGDVGRPRATLLWVTPEGKVIDDTFSYEHVDTHNHQAVVVRNTLEINALSRNHLLMTLACQASNNNVTAPSQISITLDLNLKPLDISVEPSTSAPLSAGTLMEFVCTSSGSRPPAVLTWWKGDKRIQAAKEDFTGGGSSVSTSVLKFTPEPEDDGVVLSCRAENPALRSNESGRLPGDALGGRPSPAALEYSRTLDVHYAPRLKLVLGGGVRSGDIREGRDVYLECEITAKPSAHEIVWHFEGSKELHTDKDRGIIVSGSSLVLQSVSRSQRGWYVCSASNREGTTRSNRLFLRVKYAPRCRTPQRRVYGVDLHESAQIRCDVDADPEENTHFRWTFNNSLGKRAELNSQLSLASHRTSRKTPPQVVHLVNSMMSLFSRFPLSFQSHPTPTDVHPSRSMINYKPLTEQDFGELLCFGSNEVGEQIEPCIIHIVAAATPDPLENCSQVNATENSLTVECVEGAWNGGGEISALSFVAELFTGGDGPNDDTTGEMIANVTVDGGISSGSPGSPSMPVFVFSDLPQTPGRNPPTAGHVDGGYRVHIYARNNKGRSTITSLTVHLLNPSKYQTKQSARLGVSWVVRPLLGLVLGLLILITLGGFALFALLKCSKYRQQHDIRHSQHKQTQPDGKEPMLVVCEMLLVCSIRARLWIYSDSVDDRMSRSVVLSVLKAGATEADQYEDSTEATARLSDEGRVGDKHLEDALHMHRHLIGVSDEHPGGPAGENDTITRDPGPPDIIQRQQTNTSALRATRGSEENRVDQSACQKPGNVYHHRLITSNEKIAGSSLSLALTNATLRTAGEAAVSCSAPHQMTLSTYATLRLYPPQAGELSRRDRAGGPPEIPLGQASPFGDPSPRRPHNSGSPIALPDRPFVEPANDRQRLAISGLPSHPGGSPWMPSNGAPLMGLSASPSAYSGPPALPASLQLHNLNVTTPDIVGDEPGDCGFIVVDDNASGRTLRERWRRSPHQQPSPVTSLKHHYGAVAYSTGGSHDADEIVGVDGETSKLVPRYPTHRRDPQAGVTGQQQQCKNTHGNSVESAV